MTDDLTKFHIESDNNGKNVPFFNLSVVFSMNKAKFHIDKIKSYIRVYASR